MKITTVLLCALLTTAFTLTATAGEVEELSIESAAASAAVEPDRPNPMLDFSRLVGGAWQIGPFRHVFEWGIGKSSVIARTYDAKGTLAAEARWFWHPGAEAIKGYSVDATGSNFVEMTTSFEDRILVNELTTIAPDGTKSEYTGKWIFTTDDSYDWTLYSRTEAGLVKAMSMTAARVEE